MSEPRSSQPDFEVLDPFHYRDLAAKWLSEQFAKHRAGQKTSTNLNMLIQVELPLFELELRGLLQESSNVLDVPQLPASF